MALGKYRWIKITDRNGEAYEFEDCDMIKFPGRVIVLFKAPLGMVRKIFVRKNLISIEYLLNYPGNLED